MFKMKLLIKKLDSYITSVIICKIVKGVNKITSYIQIKDFLQTNCKNLHQKLSITVLSPLDRLPLLLEKDWQGGLIKIDLHASLIRIALCLSRNSAKPACRYIVYQSEVLEKVKFKTPGMPV